MLAGSRHIEEHLLQNQECHERTGNNEKETAREDEPAMPCTTVMLGTLCCDLQIEHFQQLVWCCFVSFVVVHGLRKKRMFGASQIQKAFLAPFVLFMALLALGDLVVPHFFDGLAFWMASEPRYWVSPVQTVVCGALLFSSWRYYDLRRPMRLWFTLAVAMLVLVIWVSPQIFFHAAARRDGFDPAFFGTHGWLWWFNVTLRVVRLVIVVPLLEEIFWRGFLLRFLIREPFESVPFGTFSWVSFFVVTLGFCFEHSRPDWPAAFITGALYNLVAYRTRSLSSCVLAHAVTNLLLGIYIFATGQWGFW